MTTFTNAFASYGPGQLAPIGSLDDPHLHRQLTQYKRRVAKRYRVVFNDLIEKQLPPGDLSISKKFDGELWFLVKREGEVVLCAYNGRVLKGVPVVDEAVELLDSCDDVLVAGELLAPPEDGSRARVHHVGQALSDGDQAGLLEFKAFDVLSVGEEDWQQREYKERLDWLLEVLGEGARATVVDTEWGEAGDALKLYNDWVIKEGHEGLVVRSEHGFTFKIKPSFTVDAVVLAFGERTIGSASQIRELTLGLRREDGSFHIVGTVGNGWKDVERIQWYEKLSEIEVPSSYRMANREGTLCRFVKPEIIVEIKCSDLVTTDASDNPVRRMTLEYDEDSGYSATGQLPLVSMLHPVFLREREDKTNDVSDIGLDQVYRHVAFEDRHSEPTQVDLPSAEIVERKVFVKETKGNKAVRKYVALKTNKEDVDPRYAPFVVHFTDFSQTRKDPLKTGLRVAGSLESLQTHIDAWIDKNVKRGWEEAG